jgi:hypothetical protein
MKVLVEQTTLWKYEDASGGMKPSDSTINSTSDRQSQFLPEAPPVETSKEENQQSSKGMSLHVN